MISGPRAILLFATLLVVASGLAFGLSRLYAPARALDLTPQAEYVTAPVPVSADQPAASPVTGQLVDQAWLERTGRRTGIPVPALRAYADAQISGVGGCDLGWTTLAGIGWIESQHGTLGGRTLADDGLSSTPIVGPALGALDHAYGPMQFIPSTWEHWAADGDGDGMADINDLDDAAMTAMRYLCGTGHDLATGEGWSAAVFAYNHAQKYVDDVYAAAQTYARRTG